MSARLKRRSTGWTSNAIIGLLLTSAIVRIGITAGPAMADSTAASVDENAPIAIDTADTGSLLAALQAREIRLDERDSQISERMQALDVAETEIEEKLQALIIAEERLSATLALADGASESDLMRLTTVYENMKPKEAAALFTEMAPQFAAGFLGMMRPDVAALIMTELEPEVAYSFSVVLAGRNANVPTD